MGVPTLLDLERMLGEYLEYCYRAGSPPHVAELAMMAGVDRATLRRWTITVYGESPGKILKRRRNVYAHGLALTPSMSARDVARRAAFGTRRTYFRQTRGKRMARNKA